jgi:hypothetical protein
MESEVLDMKIIKTVAEIVEKNNDAKLGRIISLVFRVTAHVDTVKEQINVLFQMVRNTDRESREIEKMLNEKHIIIEMAEKKIQK